MAHVIFISGVGDQRRRFYDAVARRWQHMGFIAHAYIFGWDDHASGFEEKFGKLLAFIDSLKGTVHLVGISAGGTAALNAFIARPNKIGKVVIVSSPFRLHHYTHAAMLESMAQAKKTFRGLSAEQKARLLVVTGWRDQVVPTAISMLDGVQRKRVFGFTHAMSIVLATLLTPGTVRRFLRS